jgi:Fe2+ transport system protein FeoA
MDDGNVTGKLTLADLKPGETGRIVAVEATPMVRHRLMDFGFRRGEMVTMVRQAPLTDPIEFKLRGGYVSLRKTEAALVEITSNGNSAGGQQNG